LPRGSPRAHDDQCHALRRWLTLEPLEAHAFLPFGDVVEAGRPGARRTIGGQSIGWPHRGHRKV
jgi:hypothetical protein